MHRPRGEIMPGIPAMPAWNSDRKLATEAIPARMAENLYP